MKSNYIIDKHIEKLYRYGYTDFLLPNEFLQIKNKLKKAEYNIYKPYIDSEKVILYKKVKPEIILYKIISNKPLRHQDILGTLFSLNLSIYVFGDIIIDDNNYYIFVLPNITNYLESNLVSIKNIPITLKKEDISVIENYQRKYEECEIIVTSLRIDTVLSRITGLSRTIILSKMKNKEIYLNYEILTNNSYNLKEGDIFSIRKYGKYKYNKILKNTKKGNLLINFFKY